MIMESGESHSKLRYHYGAPVFSISLGKCILNIIKFGLYSAMNAMGKTSKVVSQAGLKKLLVCIENGF
ncbi:hypothetical protein Y1Q_0004909 [Alligator mississippiensis]|uniref:Uncharacterized protein n=1 Tax=Alligator mississippiensis TaxID=8496 RepID=A0A151MY65_ALLMI|nr:hypothetical protein Y1Q_0004909 [Alligator mississippiensis]